MSAAIEPVIGDDLIEQQPSSSPETGGLAARLGLAVDPLAADALPEFFFVGARRRFVVQQVVHTLYFSGGLVLMTGERGSGKTRVLDEIGRELASLADVCRIEATVLMDAVSLRQDVAAALGLPAVDSNAALIATLDRLRPAEAEPPPVVLIVDDAHLLAVPDLAECETLVHAAGGRLRLLLAGEPELLTAWEQLDAPAERIELPALQPREVADYLRTRLQAAGYRDELPLSQNQLLELMRHSRGNIAEIHQVAPLLLGGGGSGAGATVAAPGRSKILVALPKSTIAIGGAAVALAVLLLAFLYRGDGKPEDTSGRVALPLPIGNNSQPLTLPAAPPASAQSSVPLPEPAASGPAMVQRDNPPQPAALAVPPVAEPVAMAAQSAPNPPAHAQPVTAPATKPQAAAPAPAQPEVAHVAAPAAHATPVTPTPAKAVANQSKPVAKPAATPPKSTAQQQAATSKPKTAAATTKSAAKPAARSADERRLLALPDQQYVVQLMAGYSREKVTGFIGSAGGGVKVYYFESRLQGKPWYVAVTGPYPDRAAASAAITRLSPALRKEKPWPRSVSTIQADLRARAQ